MTTEQRNPAIWRERQRWLRKSSRVLFSGVPPVAAGLLAGGALALVLDRTGADPIAIGAAFVFGVVAVAAPILIAQRLARRLIDEVDRRVNMRSLVGDGLLGSGWAMDAALAYEITDLVDRLQPALVFECGSGMSTLLIAERLRRIGSGRVVAVEHDAKWARLVSERVAAAGLSRYATVVHAPLVDRAVDGVTHRWYASAYEAELTAPIDMLLVDGPPGHGSRLARYPAVPILRARFAEQVVILLDDGDRPDERRAAERWARELPGWILYRPIGKGRWLVWRGRRNL